MKLFDGIVGRAYTVKNIILPARIVKRLEALGMISGTRVSILNKRKTAVIIMVRGTRFALGKALAENIDVEAVL